MLKPTKGKHAKRFPFWRERGTASLWLVVESRFHYVGMQESMLLFWDIVTRQSAFLPLSGFNTDLDTKCTLLAKGKNAKAD